MHVDCILLCIVCYSIVIGQFGGSALVDELQGHNAVLKDCIEQLTAIESSRTSLVSQLREALEDQVHLRLLSLQN